MEATNTVRNLRLPRLGTAEEIMRRSVSQVDDYQLGLQFPATDWSCYFLYSSIAGPGPFHALNLGVHVGHMSGADTRVREFGGDQNGVFLVTALVHEDRLYRWFDTTTYQRTDAIYSRNGLDLQIGDVCRVKGSWPFIDLYYHDKPNDIVYRLAGRATYAHWVPDHVMTTNLYSFLLLPDYTFNGVITFKGRDFEVNGIGGFDHVSARIIRNPRTKGVGFWHYDPVAWNEEFASAGLFYLDRQGAPFIKGGVTTLPDGGYHPAPSFEIEYLELAEGAAFSGEAGAAQIVPRRWRATMTAANGRLVYEARPIPLAGAEGQPLHEPNVPFWAEGEWTGTDGRRLQLSGKGYMEYLSGTLDPSHLR